ncbi:MAG: ferrous iron transport protein B [Bacteroidaceae bacterium]|nr:ferrous iron transport protein B [Bacteroidaceae bacterium]
MNLGELHTGDKGIIIKVKGHGGFRKRIIEMGFIKGQQVEVLQNAPFHDPVKYKIMGYEVSLRHDEAQQIEVIKETPKNKKSSAAKEHTTANEQHTDIGNVINVALVGNPNCGKTSLFNFASGAHERVGNYSGVTVDAKVGKCEYNGYQFNLVDLPGTYSLSAYSPEELYVRKEIVDNAPDIIINVIDTSNLERNLYLTTQLIDMHLRIVCALNMYDEAEKRGDNIDCDRISELFGVPMIPTVFTTGRGVKALLQKCIDLYEGKENEEPNFRHIHINHGHEIENGITELQKSLKTDNSLSNKYSTRYLAIKLLEGDKDIENIISRQPYGEDMLQQKEKVAARVREETKQDSETAIMDAKYGFIHGALQEADYKTGEKEDTYQFTHILDKILTHKYFGFPIFLAILYLMFKVTFDLGQYPMDWIESLVQWFGKIVGNYMPAGILKDCIVDGIIAGVGGVIIFLPNILILYFFISYMEDSGYMSRAAFIMDKLMHKIGLHGKSFIPMIMGFGCNVPAIMSTRIIESRHSRMITMLITPFMSCSARLPIYIMLIGTFFAVKYQSLILFAIYLIGIIVACVMSKIFSRFLFKGEDIPFVMELPPYRFPTWKAIGRHTWEKGKQYLKKMGTIIMVASIAVWCLSYFPHNAELNRQEQQEQSYIGQIGKAIAPVFTPQGFDWKLDVGIVAGVGAKEIVASTMGVLYNGENYSDDENMGEGENNFKVMKQLMMQDGITPLIAFSFIIFVLLYFPCFAVIIAIKNESGWQWALFAAVYTTAIAWIVSALITQIGLLFA